MSGLQVRQLIRIDTDSDLSHSTLCTCLSNHKLIFLQSRIRGFIKCQRARQSALLRLWDRTRHEEQLKMEEESSFNTLHSQYRSTHSKVTAFLDAREREKRTNSNTRARRASDANKLPVLRRHLARHRKRHIQESWPVYHMMVSTCGGYMRTVMVAPLRKTKLHCHAISTHCLITLNHMDSNSFACAVAQRGRSSFRPF
jgi:hypothetical protein